MAESQPDIQTIKTQAGQALDGKAFVLQLPFVFANR